MNQLSQSFQSLLESTKNLEYRVDLLKKTIENFKQTVPITLTYLFAGTIMGIFIGIGISYQSKQKEEIKQETSYIESTLMQNIDNEYLKPIK